MQTGLAANGNPFRYSTKYHDEETGFYYYDYRYLSPTLGRWFSRDPMEERGSTLLYVFVDNDPANYVDTDGLIKFGKWTLEVAWYKKWGFDFSESVDDQSKDCCDKNGVLIKKGWKKLEAEGDLQFGLGVGVEISIGTKGGGSRTYSRLIKGPQIHLNVKSEAESQSCGGPAVGKKACVQTGIDVGGGFSFGYLVISVSGESGVKGYVEGCIDAETKTWDVKLCAGTYGHAVFALGLGPVSKPIWEKDWSVDPACVTIGRGSF